MKNCARTRLAWKCAIPLPWGAHFKTSSAVPITKPGISFMLIPMAKLLSWTIIVKTSTHVNTYL